VPRDEPPQDLRSDVDAKFLNSMLREMPVPVVAISPNCADEPWTLAFLAHEVGHHVQHDFLPNGGLIDEFGAILMAHGGASWKQWGQEIFADVFSILTLGHWALWALTELVWSDTETMLDDSNPRYPSPLLRLLFMQALADKLSLDGKFALRGMDSAELLQNPVVVGGRDLRQSTQDAQPLIGPVVEAVLDALPHVGKLPDLLGFQSENYLAPGGMAHLWSQMLVGSTHLEPRQQLASSRMVLSGGVEAWAKAVAADEKASDQVRQSLKTCLPTLIVDNREEITREAQPLQDVDLDRNNQRLVQLLLQDGAERAGV
jgi:hypothetical protein